MPRLHQGEGTGPLPKLTPGHRWNVVFRGGKASHAPECTLSPSGRRGTTTNVSTPRIGGRDSSKRAKPALSGKRALEPRKRGEIGISVERTVLRDGPLFTFSLVLILNINHGLRLHLDCIVLRHI